MRESSAVCRVLSASLGIVCSVALLVVGVWLIAAGTARSRARPTAPGGTPVPYLSATGQCIALDTLGRCALRYVPIEGQACLVVAGSNGFPAAVDCWPRSPPP